MFALFFHGDVEAALKVGELAWSINPNDTELAGEYGYRLALSGDWERGCQMIEKTRQQNPGPLGYYETALALCAYFRGDFADAAMWITKTTLKDNPNYHAIAAAIFAETGQAEAAKRERDWLYANVPKLVSNLRAEMALRLARPEDIDRLIESLRKAGVVQPGDDSASLSAPVVPSDVDQ